MKQKQALDDIAQAFGRLRHEISLSNAAGYLAQNKVLENILLPVFRIIWDAPGLRNANAGASNVAYVDLVDAKKKLAVQVTTTRDVAKITDTLTGFTAAKKHRQFRQLKFFIFAAQPAQYRASSSKRWQKICKGKLSFSPARDILQFEGLIQEINNLSYPRLVQVRNLLARSIVGVEYVDVAGALSGQAQRQVENEKCSGKYIPEVFVETSSAKELARLFWHPFLFFDYILDRVERSRLVFFNRELTRCGLTPLPLPLRANYQHDGTWAGLGKAVDRLRNDLAAEEAAATPYEAIEFGKPPPFAIHADRRPYYDENVFGLKNWVRVTKEFCTEMREDLAVLQSRVFILTGKAGQGKTNLVCDLVEKFVLGHGIPCAYFTGLQLGRVSSDLPDHIRKVLFQDKVAGFEETVKLLSDYAVDLKKPFVFLFEGLNEHTRLPEFAGQLEELIKVALRHPSVRFFLTCRSEYFEQRFGNLQRSTFASEIFVLRAAEQRMDDTWRQRMLDGYFEFFGVDPVLVADVACEVLRRDTLLLRFFCEAYGKRNKAPGYVMPPILHIYRSQIFELYLTTKLQSAADARDRLGNNPSVRGTAANLLEVIKLIVGHMVTQRKFADVPLSAIPADKQADLVTLLDEDIVLRRDPVNNPISLAPNQDVLNFTYDEFRDFLIARYLIDHVYPQGTQGFLAFLAAGANGAEPISEGIKRFLFYLSRQPANAAFRQFYAQQPTYNEAYPDEIFSVDQSQLEADDRQRVGVLLAQGGQTGRRIARRLASRWHPTQHPVLNLSLLIEVVGSGDDARHAELIQGVFNPTHHRLESHSVVEEFCELVEARAMQQPESNQAVFDFLPMLFRIEAEPGLDSPGVRAFRKFAATAPVVCAAGLVRSLQYSFTVHRPYVWRLLTELNVWLPDPAAVRAQATAVLSAADHATTAEINRFLTRVP